MFWLLLLLLQAPATIQIVMHGLLLLLLSQHLQPRLNICKHSEICYACCKFLVLCRYKFGTVDAAGVYQSLYSGSSIADFGSSLMLSEGSNTLYACVSDTDGAQSCETEIVTVKKDEKFRLSDAVSKFDVGHLTSTNDVGVLAAGASALLSMNAYAQQQVAGDAASGGNDTSINAADEAQKKKLQEEIDTKAGALINSLASNADNLVSDPQSMQQVGAAWDSKPAVKACGCRSTLSVAEDALMFRIYNA
jgi:hypothetical protein